MKNRLSQVGRRKALKIFVIGTGTIIGINTLPEKWAKPVVDIIILPAHAQTSGPPGGQVRFETPGSYEFVMPAGVSSFTVTVAGGDGGGGGGNDGDSAGQINGFNGQNGGNGAGGAGGAGILGSRIALWHFRDIIHPFRLVSIFRMIIRISPESVKIR